MLGKYFYWGAIAAVAIILGMLLYPTVHTNWSGINVSGFIPLVQGGMIVGSYLFVAVIAYVVIAHIRK